MKKYLVYFLTMGLLFMSCSSDDDEFEPSGPSIDSDSEVNVQAQDFIWKATNLYYFWQGDVPNLADDRFTSSETSEYLEFLQSESDPGEFFNNRLRFSEDRFTFFNADYRVLTSNLSGNVGSNGLEFGLSLFPGTEDVFGFVEYILPNTDAATKDIRRGDIFTGINGQSLNLSNFRELLALESYTLNMADLENNTITPNGREVALTKAVIQINPIFIEKVIETNGRKIGYLMYNSFLGQFDGELNDVFGRFKSEGITDLVLDLRYNPGGSVLTAQRISSMIYDSDEQKVFSTSVYNDKYAGFLDSQGVDRNRYFQENVIVNDGDGNEVYNAALNTLNLTQVHILALRSSASASELVINSLEPYMDVIHVGDTTTGKNEFSTTLVDNPGRGFFYSPASEDEINPENSWAIQPLIGRSANADGFSDYTGGLIQDIFLEEDLSNFGVLGEPDEPLLARAIQDITGETAKSSFSPKFPLNAISNSNMFLPLKDNMYVNDLVIPENQE